MFSILVIFLSKTWIFLLAGTVSCTLLFQLNIFVTFKKLKQNRNSIVKASEMKWIGSEDVPRGEIWIEESKHNICKIK